MPTPVVSRIDARCAWCGLPFNERSSSLGGRIECDACGVQTTFPKPSAKELEEAYGSWYRPESGRFGRSGDRLLRYTRGRLARRVDAKTPPGAVLDVGAGDGSLVDALTACGRRAAGLDPFTSREDFLKIDVTEVTGEWAAAVFWHSLEHLPNPTEALRSVTRVISPGGFLIISIPNVGSLQAAVFGDRWFPLDLPRHLVHIPARALLAELRALGFVIERVSYVRGGQVLFGWLHGLVGTFFPSTDLYDAIRSSAARRAPLSPIKRLVTLVLAILITPLAVIGSAIEIVGRRSGTVYVEARAAGA